MKLITLKKLCGEPVMRILPSAKEITDALASDRLLSVLSHGESASYGVPGYCLADVLCYLVFPNPIPPDVARVTALDGHLL